MRKTKLSSIATKSKDILSDFKEKHTFFVTGEEPSEKAPHTDRITEPCRLAKHFSKAQVKSSSSRMNYCSSIREKFKNQKIRITNETSKIHLKEYRPKFLFKQSNNSIGN